MSSRHRYRSISLIYRGLITLVLIATFGPLATAEGLTEEPIAGVGCDAKQAHLQRQLEQAREHDQAPRIAGLQRALNAVEEHCTTDSLIAESRETLAELDEERREEREALAEARQDEDSPDMAKHQRELDELAAEIEQEQTRLEALQDLPASAR